MKSHFDWGHPWFYTYHSYRGGSLVGLMVNQAIATAPTASTTAVIGVIVPLPSLDLQEVPLL